MEQERRISVVPFTPELLPAVRGFSESYWKRPTSDAYYAWRYLEPAAFSRMFVAMRGDECVGTLFALRKTYRLRGAIVPVLEVFDWHALAEMRHAGVGIRLMRAMMRQPERILAVGGTGDVHAALPLMGWQDLDVANAYELLLGPEPIAERLERTRKVPRALTLAVLSPVPRAFFGPRRVAGPAGGTVSVDAKPAADLTGLFEGELGCDFVQQPDPALLDWLTRSRWSGSWRFVHFRVGGTLRGWAMTRTHVANHGLQGTILELFAPRADAELYRWMVSETALSLVPEKPLRIVTRSSDPALQLALVASGFRHAGVDAPGRSWPRFGPEKPGTMHFSILHSDQPMLPYELDEAGGRS